VLAGNRSFKGSQEPFLCLVIPCEANGGGVFIALQFGTIGKPRPHARHIAQDFLERSNIEFLTMLGDDMR
jgi:hypothetical protein